MGEQSRIAWKPDSPGPYIGIITNHQLYSFMGSLEVSIIKGTTGDAYTVLAEHVTVKYLSPFYGVTNLGFQTGTTVDDYDDTQKSYGMWMVPPDIGVRVMCIFVDGDTSQGYWMGCVMDRNMNYMLPGIASYIEPSLTSDQQNTLGQANLPVAEYNKTVYGNTTFNGPNDPGIVRPIHPFAYVLKTQGLLNDNLRGITSSSARREAPSMVFGISTPGPVDTGPNAPKTSITTDSGPSTVYPSRLGGTTFVMDDGDMDDQGNITNELVRIRTRTGHQILMHNTKDFIYINNSKGTAWIELTSNGKIDIYAEEAISIHTKDSFNFRADNDINFDAGGNINMHAFASVNINSDADLSILAGTNAIVSASTELAVTAGGALKLAGTSLDAKAGAIRLGGTFGVTGKATFSGPTELHGSPDPVQPTSLKASPLTVNSVGGTNSTLLRIPQHEPWDQHEDTNPEAFSVVNISASRSATNFKSIPGGTAPLNVPAPPAVDAAGAITWNEGLTKGPAAFAKTTQDFQLRLNGLAVKYKELTGSTLTINSTFRSKEEQQALYDAWANAKGGDTRNTPLGNITTPVNPRAGGTSPHMQGRAADMPPNQATILYSKKWDQLGGKTLLEQFGFIWGGTFSKPDRVHIQVPLGAAPVANGPNVLVVIFRGTPSTIAASDIDSLVSQINQIPNHSAVAYNWEAASKNGVDQSLVSKINSNNGPIILIGYSKGAESIIYLTPKLTVKVALALYLDPVPVVIFNYITDTAISKNVQQAICWYSKASAWPPEFKNRTPSSGGRVTLIEIPGTQYIHNSIPAKLTPDILNYVKAIKVDKTNTTE